MIRKSVIIAVAACMVASGCSSGAPDTHDADGRLSLSVSLELQMAVLEAIVCDLVPVSSLLANGSVP